MLKKIGVSPETIRHYERIGILPQAVRAENGYRIYSESDIEQLRFINRARQLHFTLDNIAEILAFREDGTLPCAYVQELITSKISEVETRIQELEMLRSELLELNKLPQELQINETTDCICQIIETDKDN
ncbi:MAG: heavy metal-responsive transcriptional regulator [Anaerolineae bacterium]|nr:heavy metal-responsive transcriptional regulator [Anaerolineae bacterium]